MDIRKDSLPTATVSAGENSEDVIIGVDLSYSCDYVGIPSTEYKRLRDTIEAQRQEIDEKDKRMKYLESIIQLKKRPLYLPF